MYFFNLKNILYSELFNFFRVLSVYSEAGSFELFCRFSPLFNLHTSFLYPAHSLVTLNIHGYLIYLFFILVLTFLLSA